LSSSWPSKDLVRSWIFSVTQVILPEILGYLKFDSTA
jgi:hypothetical protein